MTTVEPGILFDGVWKKFKRGEIHDSLRDLIPAMVKRVTGRAGPKAELHEREFWALKDVSFEVGPGEVLGIIGANGAGKSTILKVMNRILQPTRGVCEVRGRAGSLIEISAGFHQDLSGRQNVFLQGAIMGMRTADIQRKFDEIVEFSGIGEFIDTPVKRYSSGMNARLGFAIAAHLDPDVLIIDEVLAVGDLTFQNKAFGRIRDLARSGIPVALVSHQLDRVAELCTRVMLLEQGQVVCEGTPRDVLSRYVDGAMQRPPEGRDDVPVRVDALEVLSALPVASGDRMRFRIRGTVAEGTAADYDPFNISVRSAQTGEFVFSTIGAHLGATCPPPGRFVADFELQMNVRPGIYVLETWVLNASTSANAGIGPSTYLQVSGGPGFDGPIQMSATLQVHEPANTTFAALG